MLDKRTVLAKSLHRIADLTNFKEDITLLSSGHVKKHMVYANIPEKEKWRIGVVKNMLSVLNKQCPGNSLTDEEAAEILEYACTS